jgi:hypothetical protein
MNRAIRPLVPGGNGRRRVILGLMARTAPRFSGVWIALGVMVAGAVALGTASGSPSVIVVLSLALMLGIGFAVLQMRNVSLARGLRRVRVENGRRELPHS